MTRSQRAFTLIAALLFLLTSVGFSLFVFFQPDPNEQADSSQTAAQDDQNDDQQPEEQPNDPGEEKMLQGTKLEDFTPVESVSELKITDIKEGNGQVVPKGATVTAHYTGALAKDGTIFQSSRDFGQPIPFSLNEVIKGWTDGVPGMKVGGIRRLVIPYQLAYGDAGRPDGGIPPQADLVFDIEITAVEQ